MSEIVTVEGGWVWQVGGTWGEWWVGERGRWVDVVRVGEWVSVAWWVGVAW